MILCIYVYKNFSSPLARILKLVMRGQTGEKYETFKSETFFCLWFMESYLKNRFL